ncbi:MAG: autorepressor SdpR family transcription factor [Gemmatimonadales bacterium]
MTSNKVFKALADPTRRRVLELLRDGAMTAGELAERFPVSKPTMSAHFSVLQEAGLVEAEKAGRVVYYRLKLSVAEDALLGFADALGIGAAPRVDRGGKPARPALRGRGA